MNTFTKHVNKYKVSAIKLKNSFLSLCILILLEIVFSQIILPNFSFPQDIKPSINFFFLYALGLCYILFILLIPTSDFTYAILNCMLILLLFPAIIVNNYMESDWRILFSHSLYFLSIYFFCTFIPIRIRMPNILEGQRLSILFIIAALAIMPFVIIFTPYINFNNFLLIDIYSTREIEETVSNTYTRYFYSWLTKIIIPIVLIYSLVRKDHFKSCTAVAALLFLFLAGGHKGVFLGVFLVIALRKGDYSQKVNFLFMGIAGLTFLSLILFYTIGDFSIPNIVHRRVFFIPAILDVEYFNFFQDKPLFWGHSFLGSIISYPFSMPPQNIIGEIVFLSKDVFANNGIISDGFMNMGMAGVVVNILIVSVCFAFLSRLRISTQFFGVIFLFFYSLVSSFLPIVLITHGGLLLLFIGQFFLKDTSLQND